MSSTDLELRLVKLVSVVLASAAVGCGSDGKVVHDPDTSGGGVGVATASAVPVPVVTTPASSIPPEDPRKVCATYRDKVAPDPTGPKLQYVTEQGGRFPFRGDLMAERLEPGKIQCHIVWERIESSKTMMVAPTCCPQGRGDEPCPPASPQQFRVEKSKVQTVVLEDDGDVVSSSLAWNVWEDEPEMHNCGRRPEGFVASRADATTREGACLAEMAELEAASIGAFDRLARELGALGAPASLVDRARGAKRDEVRHARVVRSLARARGATPRPLRSKRMPVRRALDVAIENAVEGCVFETFGAAVATFQADRAADPAMRAAFVDIAIDERAHASLARDVHAFLATVLDDEELAVVARAKRDALAKLRASVGVADTSARAALGLPRPAEHRALAEAVAALG